MKTAIIEAVQRREASGNWGKFLVGIPDDDEWGHPSEVSAQDPRPLLAQLGWDRRHIWVLDLSIGEGAFFRHGGSAHADLDKHKIYVCPLFEPFLEWLYRQPLRDVMTLRLPDLVELPDAPPDLWGYRRPGRRCCGCVRRAS